MIRSIMVPTDGSSRSLQALPYAIAIARAAGASITLVQVHRPLPFVSVPGAPGLYDDGFEETSFELEVERLKEIAVHAETESGVRVGHALKRGNVVEQLLEHARANNVDLIVMSTHGRTGISRAWLGSNADAMVRTSHVPILLRRVTRRPPKPSDVRIGRILVPMDGSAASESVLRCAVDIGAALGASYSLVRVQEPASSFGMADLLSDPHYEERVKEHYESYLTRAAQELLPKGSTVDTHVVTKHNPAAVISKLATDTKADIVAIATRGRKGVARFALGSVADKVLRNSRVPVLIYSPGDVEIERENAR